MPATDVIGRDAELALMEDFLDALAAGPSGLVIEGEAGAGKTTLWLAAAEEARKRGYRVLETRPAEAEAGLPFAGLGDLVEGTLDEVLDELPEPQAEALRVALLLAPPGDAPPDERAVAVAVLGVLRELAREDACCVAVDDVQWLDPPSAKVAARFAWRRGYGRSRSGSCWRTASAPTPRPGSSRSERFSPGSRSGRSRSGPCTGCCTRGSGSSCRGPPAPGPRA